jgi:hypothetical protein
MMVKGFSPVSGLKVIESGDFLAIEGGVLWAWGEEVGYFVKCGGAKSDIWRTEVVFFGEFEDFFGVLIPGDVSSVTKVHDAGGKMGEADFFREKISDIEGVGG